MAVIKDHELLEDIKRQRELHACIKHLVIIAHRLFAAEKNIAEIREHLGLTEPKNESKAEKEAAGV
jgi:hypothetical protein